MKNKVYKIFFIGVLLISFWVGRKIGNAITFWKVDIETRIELLERNK
ncbi:hypothetical protein LCGC14_1279050 [marine sediment metagenome]|uniref:Uncharacterized protein n=1 Tax=marine sediment metagenome TaxID=412755 RepID=A0A0F9LH17_9ZZZZ